MKYHNQRRKKEELPIPILHIRLQKYLVQLTMINKVQFQKRKILLNRKITQQSNFLVIININLGKKVKLSNLSPQLNTSLMIWKNCSIISFSRELTIIRIKQNMMKLKKQMNNIFIHLQS